MVTNEKDHKKGRIEETSPRDLRFQQLAGIKNLEPAVERGCRETGAVSIWTRLREPGRSSMPFFSNWREGNENSGGAPRQNAIVVGQSRPRCFAVELLSDKLLGSPKSEEPSGVGFLTIKEVSCAVWRGRR